MKSSIDLREWAQTRLGKCPAQVGHLEVTCHRKYVFRLPVLRILLSAGGELFVQSADASFQSRVRSMHGFWQTIRRRSAELGVKIDPDLVTSVEVAPAPYAPKGKENEEVYWAGKTVRELFSGL